jgi:hypothetical protein
VAQDDTAATDSHEEFHLSIWYEHLELLLEFCEVYRKLFVREWDKQRLGNLSDSVQNDQ